MSYELSPYPLALFDNSGMRHTKKSALYTIFPEPLQPSPATSSSQHQYVTDGGFLLHRVVWAMKQTFEDICNTYCTYIKKHFKGETTIVFDGYPELSLKGWERQHRYAASTPEIIFDKDTVCVAAQETFLANTENKTSFISMLTDHLRNHNVSVLQAVDDADRLIVTTGIELHKTGGKQTFVVGEDIDLLVLLVALHTESTRDLFLLKPGRGAKPNVLYDITEIHCAMPCLQECILFLYMFTGGDYTSSMYGKGKTKSWKTYSKLADNEIAAVFNSPDSTPDQVYESGCQFFCDLYKAGGCAKGINYLRYLLFSQSTTKMAFKLESLPPTADSARQHCYRVYLIVQKCLGNDLDPTKWGWRQVGNQLIPVENTKPPAPPQLLKTMFCRCTRGCTGACGCRKIGTYNNQV